MPDDDRQSRGETVWVVDDDALFRESIEENLREAGYSTEVFRSGPEVLGRVDGGARADLILLDWKMPGMTGMETLRALRAGGIDIPVIFLTALTDQIFEEAAFAGGAVDFVEKARSFGILQHRIMLILAGAKQAEGGLAADAGADEMRVGPLQLYPESHRVLWNGKPVELTLAEFTIIQRLALQAGRDMRYRELYDLVRGEGFAAGDGSEGYRANVRTFIKRIRQKFRTQDDAFDEIQNFAGYGYRWRDPAEREDALDR